MSTVIDEKVVSMQFDNKQFQNGAQESISTLERLKKALDQNVNGENFDALDKAASKVDLSGLQAGIEALSDRFSTLGVVGMTVIQNITNALMSKVSSAVNYAMDSIVSGGIQRAMNIENARFQLQGLIDEQKEGAGQVQAIMDDAMNSVDGTAYAYDEAAKAASMFAATGMRSGEEMQNALKGIAGVAATTNSDYESLAQIFTTVSGQGRVMADQLNQLASRGLNAAATLKDYFNGVNDGSIKASENVTKLIKDMAQSALMTEEEATARKEALEASYETQQKALEKEYNLKKKAYDKEYDALKESLDKEYEAKKEQLDANYEALSKSLDKQIETAQEANEKQLEEAEKAYENQVEAYKKATEERIALIDKEYLESIKLIDEEKYNRLKAIDDEINAINAQSEAEEKAREKAEQEEKLAELQKAVDTATSAEAREKAEKNLADYLEKLRIKEVAEQRKAAIANLKEQKEEIKEEADLKKEAAKEKRDTAVKSVQEESKATLSSMQEAHKEEIKALKASQAEQITALKESKAQQLNDLKKAQNEELKEYKKGQNAQLEALKEKQSDELALYKEAQNKKLAALKESIKQEEKLLKAGSGSLELTEADIRKFVSDGKVSFDIFSEAMASAFGDHAKDANKTFNGAMSNIRAAFARTGAMFVSPLIEQEGPMVGLFNTIREKINDMNKALAPVAETFTKIVLGAVVRIGRWIRKLDIARYTRVFNEKTGEWEKQFDRAGSVMENFFKILEIGMNLLEAVVSVLKPIKDAFVEAFTPSNFKISELLDFLVDLTEKMKLSDEESGKLKDAFKGIFDVIKAVIDIIGSFISALFNIKGPSGDLRQSFFDLVGSIGEALSGFADWIKQSDAIQGVFNAIAGAIQFVIDKITGLFKVTEKGEDKNSKFGKALEVIKNVAEGLGKLLSPVVDWFKQLGGALLDVLKSSDPIAGFFKLLSSVLVVDLISGIKTLVSKFQGFADMILGGKNSSSILSRIGGTITQLQNNLKAMTMAVNAGALKDIAFAVLMLAGAMFLLSTIDEEALGRTLVAVSILLGELAALFVGLKQMTKTAPTIANQVNSFLGKLGTVGLATALLEIAGAVLILSFAVKNLAKLSWEELIKGLVGVTILLAELVGVMKAVDKLGGPAKLGSIGAGLLLVATAVLILTNAVAKLASFSVEELMKGLVSVGALLLELAIFTKLVGGSEKLMSIGAGLLMVSGSVLILYRAVKGFAGLEWEEIKKGLVGVGGVLLELAGFTKLAGGAKNMISIGIGMVLLGAALNIVYDAFAGFASLSWEQIGKGATAMGAALAEMVLALDFTTPKAILPAGGLWILSEAITNVAPAFVAFGQMTWEEIAKAATAMGSALAEMTLALDFTTPAAVLPAGGMYVLTEAIENLFPTFVGFGQMEWGEIGRAATAMGSALTEMTLALDFTTPLAILPAGGMWVLAQAIDELYPSFQALGQMSWSEVGRAATAMGSALGEMVLALDFTTPISILPAGGLWILADALEKIVPSFISLGQMEWENIKRAAVAMLAAIGELAGLDALLGIFSGPIVLGAAAFETAMLALYSASKMLPGITQNITIAINNINKVETEDFQNGMARIGTAIATLGDALDHFGLLAPNGAKALKTTAEALTILVLPIRQFIKLKAEKLSKTFDTLGKAIGDFGDGLHHFGLFSGVGAKAMLTVAEAIDKLTFPMVVFSRLEPKKLSKAFDILGEAIGQFGKSLKNFGLLSGVGADAMLKVADAINKLAPAMVVLQKVDPLTMALDLSILSNAFKNFGDSLDGFGLLDGIKTDAIVDMAEAVSKLSPALLTLSLIPAYKLSSMLTSLGDAFKIFGEVLKDSPWFAAKTRAEGIGALIDNISKLAEVLPPFLELDQADAATALGTLGTAFKDFAGALSETPWFMASERAEGIGALIDNISKLTEVLPGFIALVKVDAEATSTALTILGEGFKGFGEALDAAPFWGVADRGEAIATLVDSISTLTDGLRNFLSIEADTETIQTAFTTIAGGFSQFGKSLKAAPFWNPEDRGKAIQTLVRSINTLVNGLKNFLGIDATTETIKDALDTIGTAFKTFGEAVKKAPLWNSTKRSESIGGLVDKIEDLADGVAKLCAIEGGDVTEVLGAIGEAFKNFGGAIKETPFWGNADRAASLGVVIGHISDLADPIERLSQIQTDTLITVLGGLIALLKNLGSALDDFSWSSDKSNTFKSMVDSFTTFSNIDTTKLFNAINEVERLRKLCEGLGSIKVSNLNAFSAALGNTAKVGIQTFMDTFNNSKSQLNTVINTFLTYAITIITRFQDNFRRAGLNSGLLVAKGITEARSSAEDAGKILASFAENGVRNLSDSFYKAGKYAVDGFIRGMEDSLERAKDAGSKLGNEAYWAAKRALDERSPSKKMAQVGSFAGEGFVNGLIGWVEAAVKASEELGDGATDGINDAIKSINAQIQNGEDFTPVITPVLDLESLQDQANKIGGIIDLSTPIALAQNASVSFSGGISKMFDDLEASLPENSNDDVIEAINDLNTNLTSVMNRLGQLQVVLDTGTMVGELVDPLDRALGFNQVLNGRGVR